MGTTTPPSTSASPGSTSRRDEILRVAGELFRRNGYHATSMRELAKQLNLRGASLYAHIDSKEELLREIVDRAADAFLASARAVPQDVPPVARLTAFVRGHLRVVVAEIETAAVFFHEWTHLSGPARQHVVERRDAYQAELKGIIAAGAAAGDFEVDDVSVATLLTLSTLNWSYQWLDPRGRLPLEELTAFYVEYVLGALGARKGQ
jgi:AcrR family transcriptional regulator